MSKMEKILKFLGPTFVELKSFGFSYGMQGSLLQRNLEKLWFEHCVTTSNYNIFHIPSNTFTSSIRAMSDIGVLQLPFGIAEIDYVTNTWNESFLPSKCKSINHKIAKITTIYQGDGDILSVKDLFYRKQRERKSWWRQLSENPNNYYMSEIQKTKGKEFCQLEAQFPFGNIIIEAINFRNNTSNILPKKFQEDPTLNLKIVEHITSLDWGCLNLLCDGYLEINSSKELHMHPKLMPYKAYCKAIIASEDDESTKEDLNDLSLYVVELLREKGVESIIINNVKNPKAVRVAYIVTVSNESLKTGLVKLVCQRTLCGEIVHITDMAQRMYDLCVTCKSSV